ncbi:B3/B4 domain-containing protein [Kitasatospora cheerisanensis]|uniref:Solo B3/4 domain-containing protein n=1 Tax=Kitasatospora cheerisanensis KCTC 2395 TaxID=1348663 RepID=A0A066Z8N2_9ACTN|nr:phenylalanine--tRNA ligase beta subunit-related protein [Kitasatospora cheerisanensis]KDN86535.1 Solo B3/4 domain-containing protein [Kitasatospora cheerisanensis KCTC 2395]
MTSVHLHPAVAEAFPTARIALVTAHGVRGSEPWPATAAALDLLERQLAGGDWQPADEQDERIAVWHAAYRAFGTNPRRIRPSVDALGRRLAKQGGLPRINPAVDSYNAVSVRHGLPAGAFDLAAVRGEVVIRFADGDEEFTPLGEPDVVEQPKAGEVVYQDAAGVLTRHWNHRDAHRTRVTEHSTDALFVLETLRPDEEQLVAAAGELADLLGPHSAAVAVRYLDPERPRAEV